MGKSRLIQTITEAVEMESKEKVHLSAPTGLAAKNVDGETCHRLFDLPIQRKGGKWMKRELTYGTLKKLFMKVYRCKLFVVDEISMVSNVMLHLIHERLESIFPEEKGETFAGRNVLVLGDLLQLPPVAPGKVKPYCFREVSKRDRRTLFPTVALADAMAALEQLGGKASLWECFDYAELTENMRQAGDRAFADLLNELRVGQVTPEVREALKGREVPQEVGEDAREVAKYLSGLRKEGKEPVCLLPTNAEVRDVNLAMLVEDKVEVTFVHAVDQSQQKKKYGKRKGPMSVEPSGDAFKDLVKYMDLNTREKARDAGGLEDVLPVGVGARVMLTKNLDLDRGLFNGAIGTVLKLTKSPELGVASIVVKFDSGTVESIERTVVRYTPSAAIVVTREQFPLKISYAITIHKSQGLSLECVVTRLGRRVFSEGMAYVALSRATTLEGVHLLEFQPSSVFTDGEAVTEYNRLRAEGKTGLPELVMGKRAPREKPSVVERSLKSALPEIAVSGNRRKGAAKPKASLRKEAPEAKPKGRKPGATKSVEMSAEAKVKKAFEESGPYRGRLFLPLGNPNGAQCFCNACVQGLISVGSVVDWAWGVDGEGTSDRERALWTHFNALVKARERSERVAGEAFPIRDCVSAQQLSHGVAEEECYGNGEQHDSLAFLKHLLEVSPKVGESFTFRKVSMTQCTECRGEPMVNDVTEEVELSLLRPRGRGESKSFAEMVQDAIGVEEIRKRCPVCNTEPGEGEVAEEGTLHERWQTLDFPEECRNLIIRLTPFRHQGNAVERLEGKVSQFKAERVVVGDVTWVTKAAILHEGATINRGHYVAVTNEIGSEEGVRWLVKNDGTCTKRSSFVPQMRMGGFWVYYVVLSRREGE